MSKSLTTQSLQSLGEVFSYVEEFSLNDFKSQLTTLDDFMNDLEEGNHWSIMFDVLTIQRQLNPQQDFKSYVRETYFN